MQYIHKINVPVVFGIPIMVCNFENENKVITTTFLLDALDDCDCLT